MDGLKAWHEAAGGVGTAPACTGARVAHYGSVTDELQAARTGALAVDRSGCTRLQLSGVDRRDLLQRMTTNDVASAKEGMGVPTVFITGKGRIIDRVVVHAASDGDLLVGGAGTAQALQDFLAKYIIREDVTVADLGTATMMVDLMGPKALEVLHAPLLGFSALHELMVVDAGGVQVLANRTDPVAGLTVRLIVPTPLGPALLDHLVRRGAMPGGGMAYNALRVEAGLPLAGAELTEERNPLEAGLVDAIHFNKGCYIGQEVVARVDTYMKQRRYLVALGLEGPPPQVGARIVGPDGGEGVVTSSAELPGHPSRALGYLKGQDLTVGMAVEVEDSAGTRSATVMARPAQQPPAAEAVGNASAAVM